MDDIARRPAADRRTYFEQATAQFRRLDPQLMEKDFWVCWVLRRVFELPDFREHLTFKGGTSLSKVYRIIERFSEDVDLSIEREFLGFGGDHEPELGATGKEQQRRIDGLRTACQTAISTRLLPQLRDSISTQLGAAESWSLTLADDDPDAQTLLFQFPPAIPGLIHQYFAPAVRLELGARSDHFPVETGVIQPYLAEALPHALDDSTVTVRVLSAQRTFWEKATILHALHHQAAEKPLQPRMSRHYYDVVQLAVHPQGQQALARRDLLARVVAHKSVFFKTAAARYDEAKPGSLRLIPPDWRLPELRADFAAMQPMFFSTVPTFESLIARLRRLETEINGSLQAQ